MKYLTSKRLIKILPVISVFVLLCFPFVASSALVACTGAGDCNFEKFLETLFNVLRFIIVLGVAICAIVLSYAGFIYLTAGGDTGKISKAHGMLWMAIKGFIIALCAYLIVKLLFSTLGVKAGFIQFIN